MLVNHARDSKPHCIVLSYRCARAYSSDSEKRTMPITCASPAAGGGRKAISSASISPTNAFLRSPVPLAAQSIGVTTV